MSYLVLLEKRQIQISNSEVMTIDNFPSTQCNGHHLSAGWEKFMAPSMEVGALLLIFTRRCTSFIVSVSVKPNHSDLTCAWLATGFYPSKGLRIKKETFKIYTVYIRDVTIPKTHSAISLRYVVHSIFVMILKRRIQK